MIVNYYGIDGCDVQQGETGIYLTAPRRCQPETLEKLGFSQDSDGSFSKRLSPEESAYLQVHSDAVTVTLPPAESETDIPATRTERAKKTKADVLCGLALQCAFLGTLLAFLLPRFVLPSGNLIVIWTLCGGGGLLAALIILIAAAVRYPSPRTHFRLIVTAVMLVIYGVLLFFLAKTCYDFAEIFWNGCLSCECRKCG